MELPTRRFSSQAFDSFESVNSLGMLRMRSSCKDRSQPKFQRSRNRLLDSYMKGRRGPPRFRLSMFQLKCVRSLRYIPFRASVRVSDCVTRRMRFVCRQTGNLQACLLFLLNCALTLCVALFHLNLRGLCAFVRVRWSRLFRRSLSQIYNYLR